MSSRNGNRRMCEVPGCSRRQHGHGLCRRHYDEARYLASTERDPGAVAAAERDAAIRCELEYGAIGELRSPHGTNSMFTADDERRDAWEERRDAIMAHYMQPPYTARRPWGWWRYEAGREPHLTSYPTDGDPDELDEWLTEPIIHLAERGDLTDRELADIQRVGDEARSRLGANRRKPPSSPRSLHGTGLRLSPDEGGPAGALALPRDRR